MNPDLQRRVQRYGWDKASEHYEKSWQVQLKPAHDLLFEKIEIMPGYFILDIAAGTGLITFRMAELLGSTGKIFATDISDEMVKIGTGLTQSKALSNVEFERMDAENLSFEESTFDLVTCALGLMYLPDPDRALQEMYRTLKPGGKAAVVVWGSRKHCGWAEIFPIVDARVSSDVCPMFFQLGERENLNYPFEKAGFKNISLQKISTILHYKTEDEACQASFLGGPVAMAYSRFDNQTKIEAQKEYIESIQKFRIGKGYEIPGEFVVAVGKKPN
ncbi:class I SAM-dependent methyltransferase [Algoriphagus sp.]|uniref:class I SAM-dependent methyltransferase n=1 Tax=Algoriphagus sp. TaxID=1872435 RepID=UPI0025EA3727|nr:class I SAM-dependent methyltransferase [Algoriphagus sp.]